MHNKQQHVYIISYSLKDASVFFHINGVLVKTFTGIYMSEIKVPAYFWLGGTMFSDEQIYHDYHHFVHPMLTDSEIQRLSKR